MNLGLSGRLTKATIASPLTPLFLLAALVVGLIAVVVIPREEEPQISVPMVDIRVNADGLRGPDAVELVTKPLEAIVKGIDGVEHVYSQTEDDRVMVTARFLVGTKSEDAILRVHEKIRANIDRIPVGIPEPLIVGRGINDVAVTVLTLAPKPEAAGRWTDKDLFELADKLRSELIKIDSIGLTYISGGAAQQIRVEPDPEKLSLFGVTLQQLVAKVKDANRSFLAGQVRDAGVVRNVAAGQTLAGIPDIGLLLISTRDGRPVYVKDVASVIIGPNTAEHRVWNDARDEKGQWTRVPAVSLALAKRAGANAVVVSADIGRRLEGLKGRLIPDDVQVTVTRDYGETANEKANELLFHLGLATVSIVVLIAIAIGWREAVVTFVVIPTTILLTMFAANLMGYTINRVSLFALIFSIGILVDDAIVVVENIARHWGMRDGRPRLQATIEAVAEVGNPTIVATLTVVAALLPMLFVSGLMGPYMAPIPANASAAMLFSFFVAMVVAPWLMLKLAPKTEVAGIEAGHQEGRLGRLYRRFATPIVRSKRAAWIFLLGVGIATLLSMMLFATKSVTVKLLPFDNKSEIAVVVDLPEGASLEATERTLFGAAEIARQLPEATSLQSYAGTPAPFNFNGLVRHYYLREKPEMGELQVNLAARGERHRASHDIALELRQRLKALDMPKGTSIKVVEVPPGPPVLATLLAEIYGPDAATRRAVTAELKKVFAEVPFIVDVDDSIGEKRPRLRLSIDQDRLEFFGVEQRDVYDTIQALFGGISIGYSHRGEDRNPIEIAVHLGKRHLVWDEALASTPVPANTLPGSKTVVELGQVVKATMEEGSPTIFRRDGRFADMVMAELAGRFEAPLYGMLAVADRVDAHDWGNLPKPAISLHGQPTDESRPTLLWDGEWEITWVTFRDMGAAFGAAILGIYVLVVAQFKSFRLPLVILTPIPLTLIGILVGHWLLGAPFTATSMIGFIALAGIIVRNSILLVDFIRHSGGEGKSLREVVLEAGAVRFKPILLTALAAMIGAATILLDPIFQGLAISLLFGLASSTLLTVLVIPAIYVALRTPHKAASTTTKFS
ncbi:efflux RND transporter permease subunit [Bradyrhizobium diazoefficiens]|uniref:AcrB/AcrD/AcrF family cation efflux protein n=1 Tax=Bradyrhizobium diazoefficiens (strain JCM 10833 / BCRC 13528 / IAM 13628 / NBRC 14792 / USDA 110) TaxID=224911 RepID=Q89I68_BRADU|nr:efflux RND transporter permease subunit [Bradyrhizobium diazoefficiens]AND90931.1 multidrug transporter AcrB [Bradyrhizobium diazoefficiens USDA 110]QBP24545.1 efflux RND transporter permease subunit [Bradyrhizobium diazoefficiens]QLD42483.1 efflux RND transporter permease subunit [Bradyrhizobium diazoefficiens]WLB35947.1 efflux RND transporter permease subunit [Bradyrhizobium diazoefficiens]WLC19053.1 efflux RND transporter permease subunit [Bradyrhizobium diazoefficiens]